MALAAGEYAGERSDPGPGSIGTCGNGGCGVIRRTRGERDVQMDKRVAGQHQSGLAAVISLEVGGNGRI